MCRLCGLNIDTPGHPDHPCYSVEQRAENARKAMLEAFLHDARLNLQVRTVSTRIDLSRQPLIDAIKNDVLARDPTERDFSPNTIWTLKTSLRGLAHVPSPECACIECKLDADTIPLWAREWLEEPSS